MSWPDPKEGIEAAWSVCDVLMQLCMPCSHLRIPSSPPLLMIRLFNDMERKYSGVYTITRSAIELPKHDISQESDSLGKWRHWVH